MKYSNILKDLRTNKNKTQQELADILNINRVQYNQYENNYNTIPIKHLNKKANYYQVSIDYILGLSNSKENNIDNLELDNKLIGKRLKEFQKENNLTQAKLATILNTNQSVIANYERGKTIISTSFLYNIYIKYHVSADYLLEKTNIKKELILL